MKASAPGKIILFGEHAVVYNRPALAVPVMQVHVDVEVTATEKPGVWIHAPIIGLDAELDTLPPGHAVASVILNLFQRFGIPSPNLKIEIASTIPVASGLGSGAAVSAALIRALNGHFQLSLNDAQINDLVFESEKIHHGTPSGIDNTVITFAKPVYFVKNQPIETFKVGKPFTLIIGDTGIPAPTKESVGDVRRLWMRESSFCEDLFNEISQIAIIARRSIESGQPERLGELMDQNHAFLQKLTVSSPELDALVEAARKAGALGAKLSGGGRGGNMIALVNQDSAESVAGALIRAGAKNTIITTIS